jgi:hypothetical protein
MRAISRIFLVTAFAAAPAFAQDEPVKRAVDESRRVVIQVTRDLRNQLVKEMQVSGPLRSMIVCKFTCPEIISASSRRTGWRVSAVSLKPRNPAMGMPDEWEQRVLLEFDRRVAKGEPADGLEFVEVVTQPLGKFLRYARAMPVESMCLKCHGAKESLPDAVRAQLAVDYPFDEAVGFSTGQVYGIVAVKRRF